MSVPLWKQATEMISLIFVSLFYFDRSSRGRFQGSGSAGSEGWCELEDLNKFEEAARRNCERLHVSSASLPDA